MAISNLPASLVPPQVAPALPQRGVAPFDGDRAESGVDWRRVLSAVLRFKWLIATFTLIGTIAGVGATRFIKPVYSAQTKIWIDVEGRRGQDRGPTPIRPGQLLDAESWVDLLESYVVLDAVVRDQRLCVTTGSPADAQAVEKLGVADKYQPGAYRGSVARSGRAVGARGRAAPRGGGWVWALRRGDDPPAELPPERGGRFGGGRRGRDGAARSAGSGVRRLFRYADLPRAGAARPGGPGTA